MHQVNENTVSLMRDECELHRQLIKNYLYREMDINGYWHGYFELQLDDNQLYIRQKILQWVLEIVSKKEKSLVTFEKTVNLFDRVCCLKTLTKENCQVVVLACFDIIQRFTEVTYKCQEYILQWLNQGKLPNQCVTKEKFSNLTKKIYSMVETKINHPTAQSFSCLALGIE